MSSISIPTSLDPVLFGIVPHLDVLSRLMLLQSHNGRFPIAHTKGRSARNGSTRKLYKQKGTGNARAGSARSPVRRGGGVAFGPRSKANFQISMNAQERRLGLASALSLKSLDGKIRVIDTLTPKTSSMAKSLAPLTAEGTVLVFVHPDEIMNTLGADNLHGVHVDVVTHASPAEILKYDFIVFTTKGLELASHHFQSN